MGRRVLKFDGAFGPEGCGIALSGDAYKVSVTGLAFCVIWHDTHSGDWLTAFATPYPAVPDFPLCRGQNKTPRDNLLINPPLEMTKEPCRHKPIKKAPPAERLHDFIH